MFLRFAVLVGFVLSVGAALGSFSIFSSYQTERQLRLDSESKLIQTQDSASSSEESSDQYRQKISELEFEVEKLKEEQQILKGEVEAKSGLVEQLESDLNQKKSEIQTLSKKIEGMKPQAVIPPAVSSAPIREESVSVVPEPATPEPFVSEPAPVKFSPPVEAKPEPVVNPAPSSPSASSQTVSSTSSASASSGNETAGDTRILTVNRKFNFIVINIGLKDGLRMGDKVEVVQGETQKALAQVEKIYDKFSAATLLSEDKGNPVHEGDTIRKL
ncbi:MAG TPA: hypothetical protein DIS66_01995 [Candidatus Omnitrophica bacterium]|nr:hypothetical protein [Candidatus Omnitrophota bacterium]